MPKAASKALPAAANCAPTYIHIATRITITESRRTIGSEPRPSPVDSPNRNER